MEESIAKQPVARALAKVVEEDGFKTVFVLRLSPLLPIPLGTYAYIYGASALNPLAFCSATFLGSLKPYLIDSYLGVFSKQILDGASAGIGPEKICCVVLFSCLPPSLSLSLPLPLPPSPSLSLSLSVLFAALLLAALRTRLRRFIADEVCRLIADECR